MTSAGVAQSAADTDVTTVPPAANEGSVEDRASLEAITLPRILVVAPDLANLALIPGSVRVVSAEIEEAQPRSTEDILRRVPGIYIKREEDSAVVTNVGVRGLPAGDYKTLVLEDGVPVQPGIFVGNARYYNPRVHRMEGAEVLKGVSSLRYGPNNIGGVINFLTKTPEEGLVLATRLGSWNTREGVVEMGGRSDSGESVFGVIASAARSDGWMDKGWDRRDALVKAGSTLGSHQSIAVKFTYYENDANISYRGYFPDAFEAGATFNPAPDDFFITQRTAFDVNHEWTLSEAMTVQTVAYWSEMNRDYWRFLVDGATTNADGLTVWNYTDTVQGNNRDFTRYGIESRLTLRHALFNRHNEAELGLRYMREEMLDQTVRAARATPRTPFQINRNRIDSADSMALFAQNRFDLTDALTLTAGLRVESYEQQRNDLRAAIDPVDTFRNTEWLPGLGLTFQLSAAAQLYASTYVAFAPPLVGSVVGADDVPTDAEKSHNVDIGVRGRAGAMHYELSAFQMDFSNQVDPGVSGIRPPNEGSALIRGMEASLGTQLGQGLRIDGNVTWIPTAKFGEDRPGEALKGNRLADSPEWTANLTLSQAWDALQLALLFNYTGKVFGDGMNRIDIDPLRHRGGLVPSYYTFDVTAHYTISPKFAVFGAVRNLTDERYIGGLRDGIYAGPERHVDVGLNVKF
jgi:Fe(3+) dicitrate transport protein